PEDLVAPGEDVGEALRRVVGGAGDRGAQRFGDGDDGAAGEGVRAPAEDLDGLAGDSGAIVAACHRATPECRPAGRTRAPRREFGPVSRCTRRPGRRTRRWGAPPPGSTTTSPSRRWRRRRRLAGTSPRGDIR